MASQGDSGIFFKFDAVTLDTIFLRYYNIGNLSGFSGCGQSSDGDYTFSGEGGNASLDTTVAWVVKTDTSGNVIWQKTLSSDLYNGAEFISPFAGGFYLPWGTAHPNPQTTTGGDSAIFVDKYTNAGTLIWRDTFGVIGHYNVPGPIIGFKEGGDDYNKPLRYDRFPVRPYSYVQV